MGNFEVEDGIVATVVACGVAGVALHVAGKRQFAEYKEQTTTPKEITVNNDANNRLLSAAFEGNLEDFKKAVSKGANLQEAINQRNQNALMVALQMEAYNISGYILNTPKLNQCIDYNQVDQDGRNVFDIVKEKISNYEECMSGEIKILAAKCRIKHNTLTQQQKTITELSQMQKNEENQSGKSRSGMCYAYYQMAQNANSGK